MTWTVYLVTNVLDHKRYVGVTSTSLAKRWGCHLCDARRDRGHLLHAAIRKDGIENFRISPIETCEGKARAFNLEERWIRLHGSFGPRGYNGHCGGASGRGFRHSEESKARMGELQKGRPRKRFPKPVVQLSLDGAELARYESIEAAAKAVGGHRSVISQCLAGSRRTHSGFRWEKA